MKPTWQAVFQLVLVLLLSASCKAGEVYDIVLKDGRVMDPETGLDAVRSVGINGSQIIRISTSALQGREVIDAAGLVVAPGFVDIHTHGHVPAAYELQAEDGVTTTLECEVGVDPVAAWYEYRKGKAVINYGAGASHAKARSNTILSDAPQSFKPDPGRKKLWLKNQNIIEGRFDDRQKLEVYRRIRQGLSDGGICMGETPFYFINSSREEVYQVFKLAAEFGVLVSVHIRHPSILPPDSVNAVQEIIANAAATGVRVHFNHVHTDFLTHSPVIFDMIEGAVENGMEITTESLMFSGAGIDLTMADFVYPDWQQRFGYTYSDMMLAASGEILTEDSFNEYLPKARAGEMSGWMYVKLYPEWVHKMAMTHPLSIISSDSVPDPNSHPRTAGTFGKLMGEFVREKQWLTLMEALRKITLLPVQQFEDYVPAMAKKGRIQEGMDADITVFDPQTIINRASYTEQAKSTVGIRYVLVNGIPVVREDKLVTGLTPGQPIRRW